MLVLSGVFNRPTRILGATNSRRTKTMHVNYILIFIYTIQRGPKVTSPVARNYVCIGSAVVTRGRCAVVTRGRCAVLTQTFRECSVNVAPTCSSTRHNENKQDNLVVDFIEIKQSTHM
jgi:hypothetical protein